MRRSLLIAPVAILLAACSAPGVPPTQTTPDAGAPATDPVAIATTTQLGSILAEIAECGGATSATLMGPGDDPHDFSLASSEVAALTRTKLVVANGLGLEGALESTLENVAADGATVYRVAPDLEPMTWADVHAHDGDDHHPGDGHDHSDQEYDPHVFLDVQRMAKAAGLIGAKLAEATGENKFATCGQDVQTSLESTHGEVKQILSAIPEDRRQMVTDHAAYHYFAAAYDFEIAGVVIPGGSTDAAPSSAELADLVSVVKEDGVDVMVSNNTLNPQLVETVARDSGTDIQVVQLYEGSVGPAGSGAETYATMMLTNARLLADALK
ncbi:MAG: metal ABC transporter substrate-binding protein [Propionibacteriaceae bacterium]|nr:metal ABC transporter substrate-binding protein [Propionibacteriaceae bacterium]